MASPRWRGEVQAAAGCGAETRPRGDVGLRGVAGAVLHSSAVAWDKKTMGFQVAMGFMGIYQLVICYIAIENDHL